MSDPLNHLGSILNHSEPLEIPYFPKPMRRGVFCQFRFRWIYYYGSNESTGKETEKTHLCAVTGHELFFVVSYSKPALRRTRFGKCWIDFSPVQPSWLMLFKPRKTKNFNKRSNFK